MVSGYLMNLGLKIGKKLRGKCQAFVLIISGGISYFSRGYRFTAIDSVMMTIGKRHLNLEISLTFRLFKSFSIQKEDFWWKISIVECLF